MLLSKRRIGLLPTMLLSGLMIGGSLPAASAAPAPQVPAAPEVSQITEEVQSAAALSGRRDIKVTLIGVQLSDTANSQFQRINLDYYKSAFQQADSFWGWTTVNRSNIEVTRTIPGFYSKSAHTGQTYVQMKDAVLRDLNYTPSANEVVVLAVSDTNLRNVDYSRGVEGGGFVYGNNNGVIILPIQNTLTNSVSTHELGHVFGLMHANSLECGSGAVDSTFNRTAGRFSDTSCYSKEYGDSLDVMGLSHQTAPQISSAVWDAAGYGDGAEIRNAGTPTRAASYKLTPWSQGGGNRAVKFTDPVSKDVYYLELRSPYGSDSTYAVNGNQGVKVTKDDPAQSWTASMVLRPGYSAGAYYDPNHTWQAGETFTTTGGTRVKVDTLSYGAAQVTITPRTIVNTAPPSTPTTATPTGPATPWIKGEADLMGVKNDKLVNHKASGSGSVGAPQIIGRSGWDPAIKTINVDWNADGIQDVLSNWKDGTLRVHYGKHGGDFERGKVIGKSGWNTMDIDAAVVVAGQNYPSLIARSSDGKIYRYNHSTTDVGLRTLMTSSKGYLTDLFIADVNRDGKSDIVGKTSIGYLETYMGDGRGGVNWGSKHVAGAGFKDVKSITALTGFKGGSNVPGIAVKSSNGDVKYYPLGSDNRYDHGGSTTYGYGFQDFRVSE